ncbi:hypothetical protein [Vibrio pelagius]|uniref:hypothetical protein n=1 Tax=Vibrio pelagius TaxID=28169 RepID=UPI003550C217
MKIILVVFAVIAISACSSLNSSSGYSGNQYPEKIKLEKERGYYSDNRGFSHN